MKRVVAKIAYHGKEFYGSQRQPGVRTVENDIIRDLSRVMVHPREWFCLKMAGRTDRGVNAIGNVVVFNTDFDNVEKLFVILNKISERIFYRAFAVVDDYFEPRHAKSRTYRYFLPVSGHDLPKIEECAELFIGEHDFKRFCKVDERSTVVVIDRLDVSIRDEYIVLEIAADHFLWNMVRRIVAAISSVGKGRPLEDISKALNGEEIYFGLARSDALFFIEADYGIEFTNLTIPKGRVSDDILRIDMEREFFTSLRQ